MKTNDINASLRELLQTIKDAFSNPVQEELHTPKPRVTKSKNPSLSWIESNIYHLNPSKASKPEMGALMQTIQHEFAKSSPHVIINTVGTVQHVGNGVAHLTGLPNVGVDELVLFENGVNGLTLNLDVDHMDVILLGPDENIHGGDLVLSHEKRLTIPEIGRAHV